MIKIIQAHDYFQERLDRELSTAQPSRVFSRKIRQAVRDCLYAWNEELKQTTAEDDTEKSEREKQLEEHSLENLEMLNATYSAMHLSDVNLPLLPSTSTWGGGTDDPFSMPGAASADFIRYLRSHHMYSADTIDEAVPEMLESRTTRSIR